MPDYIPRDDPGFDTWQANFVTYVNANVVALGLTALDPDVVAMGVAQTDWAAKYPANVTAQAAAQSARQDKDLSRDAFVTVVRRLAQRLQASSAVDDTERAAMGITVPDRDPTLVGPPTSKAKPAGVTACEIWMKLGGAPPVDLSECQYLATDSRTPYTADFPGPEANQTAHFIGRWMSTRNEPGPLSETVSATVPG